jgi:hypothetical protein
MALLASAPTSRSTSHRAPSVSPRPCASLRPAVHKCLSREAAWAAASARLGAAAASARLGACSSQSESLAQLPVPPGSQCGWCSLACDFRVFPGGSGPGHPALVALPAGRRAAARSSRLPGYKSPLRRGHSLGPLLHQCRSLRVSYDTATEWHAARPSRYACATGPGRAGREQDGGCHGCKGAWCGDHGLAARFLKGGTCTDSERP